MPKKPKETQKQLLFACMLLMEITHHLIVNGGYDSNYCGGDSGVSDINYCEADQYGNYY